MSRQLKILTLGVLEVENFVLSLPRSVIGVHEPLARGHDRGLVAVIAALMSSSLICYVAVSSCRHLEA